MKTKRRKILTKREIKQAKAGKPKVTFRYLGNVTYVSPWILALSSFR